MKARSNEEIILAVQEGYVQLCRILRVKKVKKILTDERWMLVSLGDNGAKEDLNNF